MSPVDPLQQRPTAAHAPPVPPLRPPPVVTVPLREVPVSLSLAECFKLGVVAACGFWLISGIVLVALVFILAALGVLSAGSTGPR